MSALPRSLLAPLWLCQASARITARISKTTPARLMQTMFFTLQFWVMGAEEESASVGEGLTSSGAPRNQKTLMKD